jgi:hypothetical protein
MAFWFQNHYLIAPGETLSIEYLLHGGSDRGAQFATTVPYLSQNEWLETVGQGLFYQNSTNTFRYWVTFRNRGTQSEAFQIRGGGIV